MMDGSILWQGILAGVVRVGTGWFKKAIQKESDLGETISSFEWRQLVSGVVVVFVASLLAYYGLSELGADDVNMLSLGVGLVVNEIWTAVFKK